MPGIFELAPGAIAEMHEHSAIYLGCIGQMSKNSAIDPPKLAFTPGAKAVFGREWMDFVHIRPVERELILKLG